MSLIEGSWVQQAQAWGGAAGAWQEEALPFCSVLGQRPTQRRVDRGKGRR